MVRGLLTGTLDAIAALIWASKTPPVVVFKYVASGAFGKAAFAGGSHFTNMVLWGVLFHFVIAYGITAVFYLTYPKFRSVFKNKFVVAFVFAITAWVITNLIIVPLSKIGWRPMQIKGILIGAGILVLTIGLPIALIADRHYPKVKRRR